MLDFQPVARQVFDAFIVATPYAPVDGLFQLDGCYYIVCPGLDLLMRTTELGKGEPETIAAWFAHALRPIGCPIQLVAQAPEGSIRIVLRTGEQQADGFGVLRNNGDFPNELSTRLPAEFPFVGIGERDRTLMVFVSRELTGKEPRILESVLSAMGLPMAFETAIREPKLPELPKEQRNGRMVIVSTRAFAAALPASVAHVLGEDEEFWRSNYRRVFAGDVSVEEALSRPRFESGSACLVSTTFKPSDLRVYLSLYSNVIIEMPLRDRVEDTLASLGVGRRALRDLVSRGDVVFVAPQSFERYDVNFLAELTDASPRAVIGTRRLAAASHLEQLEANPLFLFPGTSLDRRVLLRCIERAGREHPAASDFSDVLVNALSHVWRHWEWALHQRGAMASVAGPLAFVAREALRKLSGKDYFMELGGAALHIEWAAALGAHYAPFSSTSYSEEGHARFVLALQSGFTKSSRTVATAAEFSVAEDLLVLDGGVDLIDFVTAMGEGDLKRFRELVRGLARPGRTSEEITEVVEMWNGQVRAYERRPDRLKSMNLTGFALGTASKILGAPDLVSLSAVLLPMLPGALTLLNEELLGDAASLAKALDAVNGKLAGVHRDAVLLARMKKLVKGMK
jgi:hypothetical protein